MDMSGVRGWNLLVRFWSECMSFMSRKLLQSCRIQSNYRLPVPTRVFSELEDRN